VCKTLNFKNLNNVVHVAEWLQSLLGPLFFSQSKPGKLLNFNFKLHKVRFQNLAWAVVTSHHAWDDSNLEWASLQGIAFKTKRKEKKRRNDLWYFTK
jgi:hypothetical protein